MRQISKTLLYRSTVSEGFGVNALCNARDETKRRHLYDVPDLVNKILFKKHSADGRERNEKLLRNTNMTNRNKITGFYITRCGQNDYRLSFA